MTPPLPGTLVVVKKRPDVSSALVAWIEGTYDVAVLSPGTLAVVVSRCEDMFGREMRTVMTVQSLLVRVYNDDLEEVS